MPGATSEPVELIEHSDTPSRGRGEGRAVESQLREGSQAENETRIQNQVDPVGDPQRPHRRRCVSRAAKHRAVEEQEQDDSVRTQEQGRVLDTDGHDLFRRPHGPQEVGSGKEPGKADAHGQEETEQVDLNHHHGRGIGVFLSDPPGHHRRRRDAEPRSQGIHDDHQRLGETDGGDGIGTQPRHEKHVRQGEDGLHGHLQHHGHRQQHDPAVHADLRIVLIALGDRRPEGLEEAEERIFLIRFTQGVDRRRAVARREGTYPPRTLLTKGSCLKRREVASRQALAREILGGHRFETATCSYHLWLQLPEPWRAEEFASEARARGVGVAPSGLFAVRQTDRPAAVRLSLSAVADQRQLRRGLETIDDLLRVGPTPGPAVV